MQAHDYQNQAARTLIDKPDAYIPDIDLTLVWEAITFGAYAGAVADIVKKAIFHQHGLDNAKLTQAVGEAVSTAGELLQWAPGEDYYVMPLDANEIMILWNVIGLLGESGEVAASIEHGLRIGHGLNRDALAKELGDVLWYIAALCTKLDLDLSEVMEANIQKLKKRYPNGYNTTDSQQRSE